MAIEWTQTGARQWTDMTRAEFDQEAPLVLFDAPGTRRSRKQAQTAELPPDLFSEEEE